MVIEWDQTNNVKQVNDCNGLLCFWCCREREFGAETVKANAWTRWKFSIVHDNF